MAEDVSSAPTEVQATNKSDRLKFAVASLLILGFVSTFIQAAVRAAFFPDLALAPGEDGRSTGGLLAFAASLYLGWKCRDWPDFWRRLSVLAAIFAVLAGIMTYSVSSTVSARADDNATGVGSVADVSQDPGTGDCVPDGNAWTDHRCFTDDQWRQVQADEAKFTKAGWWRMTDPLNAQSLPFEPVINGLYARGFTTKEYESIPDGVCPSRCMGIMIRTDSLTACPNGVVVRGNLVATGNVITDSLKGRLGSMPPDSQTRLVMPISQSDAGNKDDEQFWVTAVRCF